MIDRSWIGRDLGASELVVERGRLRAFARAIGETGSVYTDVDEARRAGYADLPAPPTFLFAAELDSGALDRLLDGLGVPIERILHGTQGFTYHRDVCAGDTVTVRSKIVDIFDKKGGALEFVEKHSEARNGDGDLVAELRTTLVVRNA